MLKRAEKIDRQYTVANYKTNSFKTEELELKFEDEDEQEI